MSTWIEISLLTAGVTLFICGFLPSLRAYRSLFWGGAALQVITALFPLTGKVTGQNLLVGSAAAVRLPSELFGVAWWVLGAWLVNSLLDLILRRTLFPDDNAPHARRLFADLASVFVYVVALVGIMDTVFKQPISTVLATSGVVAIVLGLALQNTLSDVLAGLAINMERPFGAGDWITVTDQAAGQVIEINWRATRIRTVANELVVIPNSMVAKATVTNHRRLNNSHIGTIAIGIDHRVPPGQVLDALTSAARGAAIAAGTLPTAYACEFHDTLVTYELTFAFDAYTSMLTVRSDVLIRVTDALRARGIRIGTVLDIPAASSPAPLAVVKLPSEDVKRLNLEHLAYPDVAGNPCDEQHHGESQPQVPEGNRRGIVG
jgi:small-conductance mechanosensitive channel